MKRIFTMTLIAMALASCGEKIDYGTKDKYEFGEPMGQTLELIEVDGMVYDAFHDVLELRFRGTFPKDKQKMLDQVDKAIAYWETQPSELHFFR